MPNVSLRIDTKALQDNVNRIIGRKVEVIHYKSTRNESAGEYAKYISKYVPRKTGKLVKSAKIVDGAVTYSAKAKRKNGNYDYAAYQYYSDDSEWVRATPDTHSHWNRHLTTAERQAFYEDVAKIIKEKMNNG